MITMQLSRIWKNRQFSLLKIRRVIGSSMQPTLRANALVYATSLYRRLMPGDIVIINHNGLEKIKRVEAVQGSELFVLGDNALESTDSRTFGWLNTSTVQAKVIWPRT